MHICSLGFRGCGNVEEMVSKPLNLAVGVGGRHFLFSSFAEAANCL